MRIDVLTLFPELFPGPLGESIIGRASERNLLELGTVNIRDFALDARGTVDDKPYGGGPGMLMMAEPVVSAIESVKKENSLVILTTPRGRVFNQSLARELAAYEHLVIITGHYEGVDERAIELAVVMEISLGDFVLTSGVLPAMTIADAVARLLPGVLGDDASSVDESHSNNLLEYPQYTRPTEFRGLRVPEILMSGDHGKIAEYRQRQREQLTRERRPDMWENFMSQTEKEV